MVGARHQNLDLPSQLLDPEPSRGGFRPISISQNQRMWCHVGGTFDEEEAVEVRHGDAAVDGVPPVRQLVVGVEPVEVVLAVLKLEQTETRQETFRTVGGSRTE